MLVYIGLNRDKVTNLGYIASFLPVRSKSKGRNPTMRNPQVRGPRKQEVIPEEKQIWIHKEVPDSNIIRKKILGKVVEIGIRVLFSTFCYTFGGKLYHQQEGAPIGTRVSCAAANLLMEWLWRRVQTIFDDSSEKFKLWLVANYVDDSRAWVNTMKLGSRFSEEEQKLIWSQEAESEDIVAGTTAEEVTFREVSLALNSNSKFEIHNGETL